MYFHVYIEPKVDKLINFYKITFFFEQELEFYSNKKIKIPSHGEKKIEFEGLCAIAPLFLAYTFW